MDENVAAAVGVALLALAAALSVAPGLAAGIAVGTWALTLAGGLALLLALRRAGERRRTSLETADAPAHERVQPLPRPGESFDEAVASGDLDRPNRTRTNSRVNDRLERAAIDALVRHRGLDESAAREALAEGTWTDNPWAAAQFLGTFPGWMSRRERLRAAVVRGPRARCAERAADEIARIAGAVDDDPNGRGEDDRSPAPREAERGVDP